MGFDWRTWGIWLLGVIILVVWTWVPLREFRRLLAARKQRSSSHRPPDS
jgi:hypothetical protein